MRKYLLRTELHQAWLVVAKDGVRLAALCLSVAKYTSVLSQQCLVNEGLHCPFVDLCIRAGFTEHCREVVVARIRGIVALDRAVCVVNIPRRYLSGWHGAEAHIRSHMIRCHVATTILLTQFRRVCDVAHATQDAHAQTKKEIL